MAAPEGSKTRRACHTWDVATGTLTSSLTGHMAAAAQGGDATYVAFSKAGQATKGVASAVVCLSGASEPQSYRVRVPVLALLPPKHGRAPTSCAALVRGGVLAVGDAGTGGAGPESGVAAAESREEGTGGNSQRAGFPLSQLGGVRTGVPAVGEPAASGDLAAALSLVKEIPSHALPSAEDLCLQMLRGMCS